MNKLFVLTIVLTALLMVACGSSVSDETKTGAAKLVADIGSCISNTSAALKLATDAPSAQTVASNFGKKLAELAAAEKVLSAKADYANINDDKSLRSSITRLGAGIAEFRKALSGESDSFKLAAYSVEPAREILKAFSAVSFRPIEWINACADAREMIVQLMVLMEKTYSDLREAKNGKIAGDILVAYAEGVKKLSTAGVDLEKKYPFFKKAATDSSLEKPVADLRASMVKLGKELNEKTKSYEAAGDKDFEAATKKMKEILAGIQK